MVERLYNNFFLRFYNAHPALFSILVVCLGYSIYNISDGLVKFISADLTVFEVVFWNGLFAFITINILAALAGYHKSLRSSKVHLHMIRGMFAFAGAACAVYSIFHLELANFYAVTFLSPMICVLFAWIFFQDKIGWKKTLAIIMGFMGVLIIAQPDNIEFNLGLLSALALVLCHSGSLMIVRKIGKEEPKLFFPFAVSAVMTLSSLGMCLYQDVFSIPDIQSLLILALIGVCGALAGTAISTAFQIAPSASTVAPFHYIQMVWGVILGFVFWQEVPSFYTIFGSLIVIASGISIIYLEKGKKVLWRYL